MHNNHDSVSKEFQADDNRHLRNAGSHLGHSSSPASDGADAEFRTTRKPGVSESDGILGHRIFYEAGYAYNAKTIYTVDGPQYVHWAIDQAGAPIQVDLAGDRLISREVFRLMANMGFPQRDDGFPLTAEDVFRLYNQRTQPMRFDDPGLWGSDEHGSQTREEHTFPVGPDEMGGHTRYWIAAALIAVLALVALFT